MKYLLIFEDGEINQAEILPLECDESIEAGTLDVIRFHEGKFECRADKDWKPVMQ